MQVSYSRVGTYSKCPFQYRLKYIDQLKSNRPVEAADPLVIGSAMHEGIENGTEAGVDYYRGHVPVYGDLEVHEEMKLRAMIPKVQALLPEGCEFERRLDAPEFLGFIDCLAPTEEPGTVDIYDFKYTNAKNSQRYIDSGQVELYAHYLQLLTDLSVRKVGYIIIPKTAIRQKKTETLQQFRNRLRDTLDAMEPKLYEWEFDPYQPQPFFEDALKALTAEEFPRNQTKLCDWCDYKDYCQSEGKDVTMILPSTKRRDISEPKRVKIWIYGEPFSGKTTLANQFPTPLMLNTDGNIKFVDAPYIALRDTVEQEGRMTKFVSGWATLKEAIEELEKGSEFETAVLDLVEGAYEMCRTYIYDKRGWEHESDDSFRAWDMVRKEFFDTMRRLTNLPMNVVLISHEDTSRDFTARSGDKVTAVKPNIQEKVAKVVSGMVDVVARAVVRDGEHLLTFKTDEFMFGGGRLQNIEASSIPLSYRDLCEALGIEEGTEAEPAEETRPAEPEAPEEVPEEPKEAPEDEPEAEAPKKRTRRARKVEEPSDEAPAEEAPKKRTRKRRTPTTDESAE